MKKILSTDPLARKKTFMHFENDGSRFVTTEQDVTEIVDFNNEQSKEYKKGSMIGNTQKHYLEVANIPLTVYQDLIQRFGDPSKNPEAKKKWKVWLNDSNNRAFRTGGGHI
tara:strand:- start:78 stop:410 length:333 start_codon:yes stop_codon:yes gene_type:complete